jgi:hypothetical protein
MKILLLFLLTISQLFSAPAYSKMREFKNADGTSFMAHGQGNQHLNWIETKDGEILKYNTQTKNYEYAKIENKALKASGIVFEKDNSKRARSLGHINKIDRVELGKLWREKQKEHSLKTKGLKH